MNRKRVIIVDDHDIVLKGIAMVVKEALPDYDLQIDTATRGCDALQYMAQYPYDLCLLDVELPDIDGLGMLKVIRKEHPGTKVIVYTIHEELWYVKEYIKSDVEGILFKSVYSDEIRKAVRTVMEGGKFYCKRARSIAMIIDGYNPPSTKELEVLRMLAAGKSTDDISRLLGISVNTVETHRRHLLEKLGARNVAELIMNSVSEGLLTVNK